MTKRTLFVFAVLSYSIVSGQTAENIQTISIELDEDYSGYDLLDVENDRLIILAEDWHNIQAVPQVTLKLLKYLHRKSNVRILAIEQGRSTAILINRYLTTGDTSVLVQITRNTMFWGKENRQFFKDLRSFNLELNEEEGISVESVDVEYKMESAILMLNNWMGQREIPVDMMNTLGQFRQLFIQSKSHREQFDMLAVMYYYDKDLVTNLVGATLGDLQANSDKYRDFFGDRFGDFSMLIQDMFDGLMFDGLIFDYTNPNTNYKFRDRIIYQKFINLLEKEPEKNILCVFGARHATKGSSLYKLKTLDVSPVQNSVTTIQVSAFFNNSFISNDLRRFNYNYPKLLKDNPATFIKHDPNKITLTSKKRFDYTLFINRNGTLTGYKNAFREDY